MSALSNCPSFVEALLYNGSKWMKHSLFGDGLLKHLRVTVPAAPVEDIFCQVGAKGIISPHRVQCGEKTPSPLLFGIGKSRATVKDVAITTAATEKMQGYALSPAVFTG